MSAQTSLAQVSSQCRGARIQRGPRRHELPCVRLRLVTREVYERGGSGVRIVEGVLRGECAGLFGEWRRAGGLEY